MSATTPAAPAASSSRSFYGRTRGWASAHPFIALLITGAILGALFHWREDLHAFVVGNFPTIVALALLGAVLWVAFGPFARSLSALRGFLGRLFGAAIVFLVTDWTVAYVLAKQAGGSVHSFTTRPEAWGLALASAFVYFVVGYSFKIGFTLKDVLVYLKPAAVFYLVLWGAIVVLETFGRPFATTVGPTWTLWAVAVSAVIAFFVLLKSEIGKGVSPLYRWAIVALATGFILVSLSPAVAFQNGRTANVSENFVASERADAMVMVEEVMSVLNQDTMGNPIAVLESNPTWTKDVFLPVYRSWVDRVNPDAYLALYNASPADFPPNARRVPAHLLDIVRQGDQQSNDLHRYAIRQVLASDIDRVDISSAEKYRRAEEVVVGHWNLAGTDRIVPVTPELRKKLEELDRASAPQNGVVNVPAGEELAWVKATSSSRQTKAVLTHVGGMVHVEQLVEGAFYETRTLEVPPQGKLYDSNKPTPVSAYNLGVDPAEWWVGTGTVYALIGVIIPKGTDPRAGKPFQVNLGNEVPVPPDHELWLRLNTPRVGAGEAIVKRWSSGSWDLRVELVEDTLGATAKRASKDFFKTS